MDIDNNQSLHINSDVQIPSNNKKYDEVEY